MKQLLLFLLLLITNVSLISQNNSEVELFSNHSLEEIKSKAKFEKKNYYIDFTADWCTSCQLMNKTTFRNPDVINFSLKNYYALKLPSQDFDAIELQLKYGVKSFPAILFFDYNGKLIESNIGAQSSNSFLETLKRIHQNS